MNFEELSERQCFEQHEPILQEENHTYEYKHFAVYSANAQLNELTLLKTICGMLNCFGGYIFIGIKENQEGGDIRREVVGYAFNQMDKQKYKMYINTLVKRFYPKVDPSDLDIQVKFVPVLCTRGKKYLIKLVVCRGLQNYFYSFRYRFSQHDAEVNQFYKRYDCETRQVIDMSEIYNQILERSKRPCVKGSPTPTCNFASENKLYEELKENQSQSKKQAVNSEQDVLEKSELYQVMPFDAEELSSSSDKVNQMLLSPQLIQPTQPVQTQAPAELSISSESQTKSVNSEPVTASEVKHSSHRPYNRTIFKGLSTDCSDRFESYLKQFKRTRTKKSLVRGTPEYIVEFADYEEHNRFVALIQEKNFSKLDYHTE